MKLSMKKTVFALSIFAASLSAHASEGARLLCNVGYLPGENPYEFSAVALTGDVNPETGNLEIRKQKLAGRYTFSAQVDSRGSARIRIRDSRTRGVITSDTLSAELQVDNTLLVLAQCSVEK